MNVIHHRDVSVSVISEDRKMRRLVVTSDFESVSTPPEKPQEIRGLLDKDFIC